jgi:hypothetical protein
MKYADLADKAQEATAQAVQHDTLALHKSAADAHALARDASRALHKSQDAPDEVVLGLVDDEQTTAHQQRYEWHIAKSERLEKGGETAAPARAPAPVAPAPAARAMDSSGFDYLLKGGTGSDKPAEQKNVEGGTEADGDDDGVDANAPDEAEAEAAKEEGAESNEGPPPMAAKGGDYSEMNKGLNAWLSDAGEADALDVAAEDTFSKSYAGLVEEGDSLSKAGPYIGARGGKWADPAHKIPWSDKKHSGKSAPTAKHHDAEGSRELQMFTENDGDLHRQQHEPIRKNLVNKMASGKYDHAQATKLYGHLLASASQKYKKDMGGAGGGGSHAFDPATRAAAAKRMADDFHDEAKAGDHDHHLHKKHTGKDAVSGDGAVVRQGLSAAKYGMKKVGGILVPDDTKKSFASDNGGLVDWLRKGNLGPGTGDYGMGKTGKPLPKGVRQGLDERNGYAGNVEVSRTEEGGRLDGVGAHGGIGGGPAVRTGASGINEVNSAAGDAYGANQGGPDVPQNSLVSGKTGTTDQFTPDDPNDTDKMKDEHGMIIIPGAPASAYGAQGAQRSAASQGGNAYGDATAPMPGHPSSAAASASSPQTGAAGLGEKRSQGGPAYGPNHTGNQSSLRAKTHDVHGGASGMSPGAPSGSNPQVGSPGLHQNESSSKLFSKSGLDAQTGMPLHADVEVIAEQQRRAAAVQAMRKGEADVQLGLGVGPSQEAPLQNGRQIKVMMKGGIIMTDISDQDCMELLNSDKDSFGYHGRQPGFDLGNDLTKSQACPACNTQVMKALTKCPECGVDRLSGTMQKSMSPAPASGVPQTHSKGPGLRRPVPGRDVYAPDGLSFDD